MTTYWVSKNGVDDKAHGTNAAPWASPAYAATKMVAGDTAIIIGGTYANGRIVPANSGNANQWSFR